MYYNCPDFFTSLCYLPGTSFLPHARKKAGSHEKKKKNACTYEVHICSRCTGPSPPPCTRSSSPRETKKPCLRTRMYACTFSEEETESSARMVSPSGVDSTAFLIASPGRVGQVRERDTSSEQIEGWRAQFTTAPRTTKKEMRRRGRKRRKSEGQVAHSWLGPPLTIAH